VCACARACWGGTAGGSDVPAEWGKVGDVFMEDCSRILTEVLGPLM
jgi:hypothetical protein